jgi:hypothetical protein
VGINTTSPAAKLDIAGNLKLTDGTEGAGKVLTSDADGLASWATLSQNGLSGNGVSKRMPFWKDSSTLLNTNLYWDSTNSRLGIGIANPLTTLQVNSNVTGGGIQVTTQNSGATNTDGLLLALGNSGDAFINNRENRSLQFYTNNTQRIMITAGGDVGIGTTNPVNKLSVNGTVNITDSLGIGNTTPSAKLDVSGSLKVQPVPEIAFFIPQWGASNGNVIGGEFKNTGPSYYGPQLRFSTDSVFKFWDIGMNTTLGYTVEENDISRLTIAPGGNMGVGTTTPSAKLHIAGTIKITDGTEAAGKVLTSDANGLASWAPLTNNGWGLTGNAGTSATTNFLGTTDNRSLRVRTNNTEKMIVDSLGNVGIGIVKPTIKLDLDTNQIIGTSRTFVAVNDIANRGTKMSFGYNGTSNEFAGMRVIVKPGTNACGNSGDITLNTWECNTSVSREVMRINGSGNVGIGTSAPTAMLSVNGNTNNTTGSWSVFSDARIKTVNSDFTDGLNVINKIHPVKFNYNTNAPFKANGEQIGIVAQELEKIAPYMVSQKEYTNIKDLREVNNQAYVFLLINAVKELSTQNEQLKTQNEQFKADLELIKAKLGLQIK